MTDEEFLWAWDHMTVAQRDQWLATVRDVFAMAERLALAIDESGRAGAEAAEKHANGEGK